ncbi:MAG: hypothetical protein RLZZ436_2401 [Planctomycetota bacterium]
MREVVEERMRGCLGCVELIPAHVGDLEFGGKLETLDGSGDDMESLMVSVFEGVGKQKLHPETNTEEGAVGSDVVLEHIDEVVLMERSDGIAKSSDTGQNDPGSLREDGG